MPSSFPWICLVPERVQWLYQGRVLADEATLAGGRKIVDGATIHVLENLRGD